MHVYDLKCGMVNGLYPVKAEQEKLPTACIGLVVR